MCVVLEIFCVRLSGSSVTFTPVDPFLEVVGSLPTLDVLICDPSLQAPSLDPALIYVCTWLASLLKIATNKKYQCFGN